MTTSLLVVMIDARCPLSVRIPLNNTQQKNRNLRHGFLLWRARREWTAGRPVLDDRKLRLAVPVFAPTSLKTIINRFFNARCPLSVRIPLNNTQQKNRNLRHGFFVVACPKGFEPPAFRVGV